MKKIICSLMIVVILASSILVSASNFSDVKQGDWYYETVTEMTDKGLFAGKGNNEFCPDDTMTRAEFVTVVLRILFPDKSLMPVSGEAWWKPAYDLALDQNLIYDTIYECSEQVFNAPIPRQEMAKIILEVCRRMSVFPQGEKKSHNIPDYDEIESNYQYAVSVVYAHGILNGVDNKGTFAPNKSLTRAEASTVLYRVVKAIEANPVETITIHEWEYGMHRDNRNAKEGDIFIKKDGTQIVLKKDQYGILGGGQGVAPDVGLMMNGSPVGPNGVDVFTYDARNRAVMVDSVGIPIQNQNYSINATTGEGHWGREWQKLWEKYPVPDRDENPGSYEGQLSNDPYSLWVWKYGDWIPNFLIED